MRVRYGLLLVFVAACGSGSTAYSPTPPPAPPPPPAGGSTVTVTIADFSYAPSSVTVTAGTTVKWNNNGPTSHTVTSNSAGQFNSGTLSGPGVDPYGGMTSGASFTHTFASQGTFAYHCALHPTTMMGTVVVTQ